MIWLDVIETIANIPQTVINFHIGMVNAIGSIMLPAMALYNTNVISIPDPTPKDIPVDVIRNVSKNMKSRMVFLLNPSALYIPISLLRFWMFA